MSVDPDLVLRRFDLSHLAIPADLSHNDQVVVMTFHSPGRSPEVPDITIDLGKGILRFTRKPPMIRLTAPVLLDLIRPTS